MIISAQTSPPATTGARSVGPSSPPHDRVLVVGAGPAGMATAIELAQNGIPSVVLEKRGGVASRENLFAVSGPFADRLAALDPAGSLTSLLVPTDHALAEDLTAGTSSQRRYEGALTPDPARSRGDIGALLRAAGSPGAPDADNRRWSKVPIGELEEGMRQLARTRHGDLIDLRQGVAVTSLRQGTGFAEAVLAPAGQGGASDAVRGAMLVDASGADLLGGPRTVYPEQSHWIGGRFAPPIDGGTANVRRRSVTADGVDPLVTIKLPSADRTLVWAQVPGNPTSISPTDRAAIVERRARDMGIDGALATPQRTAPVSVQLWTSDEPADRRILKVGDSVRAPYFPSSTGAAAALVHDAPRAVDAIKAVLSGTPVAEATGSYSDAIRGANEHLLKLSRTSMLADLSIPLDQAGSPTRIEHAPASTGASPQLA